MLLASGVSEGNIILKGDNQAGLFPSQGKPEERDDPAAEQEYGLQIAKV